MIPWSEQVRMLGRAVKWLVWPTDVVAWWSVVATQIASLAAGIGLILGTLWPLTGAILVTVIGGWIGKK